MNPDATERQQRIERIEHLLADVTRAGLYHLHLPADAAAPAPADLIRAAETCAYQVFRVDLSRARDKDSLLAALGRDLACPEWFGANWDALADSLGNLGWRPAEGYLILLEHGDRSHARAHDDFITLLDILAAAAEEWRQRNIALWCLVPLQADLQAEGVKGFPPP